MGKLLRYMFHSLCFMFAIQLTSSCASRGFKLSQQMPGMDNKLNPVFAGNSALQSNGYIVKEDGSIALKDNDGLKDEAKSSNNKRNVASSEESEQSIRLSGLLYESPTSHVVNSTLDPQNGAVLLGN